MKRQDKNKTGDKGLSRREMLGHMGKAAYIAPAMMVLNLSPGVAQAQGLPSCPPPLPNDPCPNGFGPTPSNVKPKRRRRD